MTAKKLTENSSLFSALPTMPAVPAAGKKTYSLIFIFFLFIMSAMPGKSFALEVFLNENRSETGTIGFVDIDKVFLSYTGTESSKDKLNNEIRRKEEELARRQTKIYKQKAKAAKLRQEKELASMIPEMMESRKQIEEAQEQLKQDREALKEETEKTRKEAEKIQQEKEKQKFIIEYRNMGLPEEDLPNILKGKFPENDAEINGNSEKNQQKEEKTAENSGNKDKEEQKAGKEQKEQNGENTAAIHEKNAYESVPVPVLPRSKYRTEEETPVPLYTINIPGIGDFSFSVSTEPAKIQEELQKLEIQIEHDEDSAKRYEEQAEKELAKYEEAQTRQLLGKIYLALKKLAHKEEISVIIDKRNILYGKKAVDLTQKLLDLLETPEEEE